MREIDLLNFELPNLLCDSPNLLSGANAILVGGRKY